MNLQRTSSVSGATRSLILIGCGLLLSTVLLRGTPSLFTKGPYLQMPGCNTMTIMWESLTNAPAGVWYGDSGHMNQRVGPIVAQEMKGVSSLRRTNVITYFTNGLEKVRTNVVKTRLTNSFYVYRATLTNLAPDAYYTYSVEMASSQSQPRAFKTFSAQPDFTRFVAYGDSRSNPKVHQALAQRFSQYRPEFVLHSGDLVMAGKDFGLWSKEFFDPVAGVADRVPILSVPGNHEEDLKNYLAYFPMPGTNRWHSFDAGPVHVLALDYHFEKESDAQFRFAQKDLLESKASWKIVFVHYPLFNFGHHNCGWGHTSYLPLFEKARVDLVLSGHSHMYERFRPVASLKEPGAWAVTSITSAGGGAELHVPYEHPAHAVAVSTNHFMVFEVSRDTLRARAIRADGKEIDAFEIRKPHGHQDLGYVAQSYSEDLLKLSYEVGPSLLGKLVSLPTNGQPAKAMFSLPPLKTISGPAELEITLVPESARYYSIGELPLRVSTPEAGETNKIVWVTVSARGKKKVHGPELDPPLVFEARVASPLGPTLAYGPPSRTSRTAAKLAAQLVAKEEDGPSTTIR